MKESEVSAGIDGPEHRADAIFALAELPRTAVVFGEPPGWADDLRERGVEVWLRPTGADVDLAVATGELATRAIATGARSVVIDGSARATRLLRSHRYHTSRLLTIPLRGSPGLFLNLDHGRAARFGIAHGVVHRERWRRLRNRIVGNLAAARLIPPVSSVMAVGDRTLGPPTFLSALRELGLSPELSWFMTVSAGTLVRRNAFLLFPTNASAPAYALKYARVPGLALPFEREEQGFALAASAGGAVYARAPRPVGRLVVEGFHAAVETAAVGTSLTQLLRGPRSHAERLRAVAAVGDWLLKVAKETAAPPPALEPELHRLAREVVPFWDARGLTTKLATGLPPVPATFQHNDVGETNIVFERDGFKVLDWEWADRHGLPVGDLVYFSLQALRLLDGASADEDRDRYAADLFAGRAPSSALLFCWIRRLVQTLQLDPESVSRIVTLYLLSRSKLGTDERLRMEQVVGRSIPPAFPERFARQWLTDPRLGPEWNTWRG